MKRVAVSQDKLRRESLTGYGQHREKATRIGVNHTAQA
jgi:hypothetical protein